MQIIKNISIFYMVTVKYRNTRNTKTRKSKIKKVKTHFSIDISKKYYKELTEKTGNNSLNLYNQKMLYKLPSKNLEVNVPWDFMILRQKILDIIPKGIYGWYHEITSSCGTSTFNAIDAFLNVKIKPNYLNYNKNISDEKIVTLYSKPLGITNFKCKMPFFTAPYGCASEYGGKSDEINTMLGTIKAGGIYTIPMFSKYNMEYIANILKQNTSVASPFFMFQIYLTNDNDINVSLIERAKKCGASVIILTVDTGANNHGGLGLLETQSDLTYGRDYCGNLFYDPVFNIKCYKEKKCVGTKDVRVLKHVSNYFKINIKKLLKSYNFTDSFDYAKQIQGQGMGNINGLLENDVDKNKDIYYLSIKHIAELCHSSKSLCKYISTGNISPIPLVVKGCVSVEGAITIQKSNADGIYVSNHGGRFIYNGIAPLDVLREIRNAVKKNNRNFGVWFDGGIRNGQDIFTSYAKGAEFVGIGRPIIYSCVLYGEPGVSSITKKMKLELDNQCRLCGQNNLNDYDKLKLSLYE